MTTTRLLVQYDGTDFAGWARQPGLVTVQGELERALAILLRGPVTLSVAGRTDRGVHAWGQVASYRGPPPGLVAVNALTPPGVSVRHAQAVRPGFDARRDARSRTYCFRLLHSPTPNPFERRRALHWPQALDRDALHACAAVLVGTHDFTAFTPKETDHVRFERIVSACAWHERGDLLELWITADAFLRHMNRALVGTMLQVATGRRSLSSFEDLLLGRPRTEGGPTAPPHGLYFASARYADDDGGAEWRGARPDAAGPYPSRGS